MLVNNIKEMCNAQCAHDIQLQTCIVQYLLLNSIRQSIAGVSISMDGLRQYDITTPFPFAILVYVTTMSFPSSSSSSQRRKKTKLKKKKNRRLEPHLEIVISFMKIQWNIDFIKKISFLYNVNQLFYFIFLSLSPHPLSLTHTLFGMDYDFHSAILEIPEIRPFVYCAAVSTCVRPFTSKSLKYTAAQVSFSSFFWCMNISLNDENPL